MNNTNSNGDKQNGTAKKGVIEFLRNHIGEVPNPLSRRSQNSRTTYQRSRGLPQYLPLLRCGMQPASLCQKQADHKYRGQPG